MVTFTIKIVLVQIDYYYLTFLQLMDHFINIKLSYCHNKGYTGLLQLIYITLLQRSTI